jgi:hypothetical protein
MLTILPYLLCNSILSRRVRLIFDKILYRGSIRAAALEEIMHIIFALLTLLCGTVGAYLFLLDAELLGVVTSWWNSLLTVIDPGTQTFGKAIVLLAFAAVFGILSLIFDRRRRGVDKDPAKP